MFQSCLHVKPSAHEAAGKIDVPYSEVFGHSHAKYNISFRSQRGFDIRMTRQLNTLPQLTQDSSHVSRVRPIMIYPCAFMCNKYTRQRHIYQPRAIIYACMLPKGAVKHSAARNLSANGLHPPSSAVRSLTNCD